MEALHEAPGRGQSTVVEQAPEQVPVIPERWFPEIWKRLAVLELRVAELPKLKRLLWTIIGMLAVDIFMGHRSSVGDQALTKILESLTTFFGYFAAAMP